MSNVIYLADRIKQKKAQEPKGEEIYMPALRIFNETMILASFTHIRNPTAVGKPDKILVVGYNGEGYLGKLEVRNFIDKLSEIYEDMK